MKKLNSILATLALFALASTPALLVGCKHADSDEHGSTHIHKYTWSMHPEVVQDSPGSCPKCGMKLVHKD